MTLLRARPIVSAVAACVALGVAGCSDDSRQSGTQAPVQQADKDAWAKSSAIKKQQMMEAKKRPRSRKANAD